MGPENVEEFKLAAEGEEALTPFLEREARTLGSVTAADLTASLGGLLSDVDRAALARFPDYADFLAEGFRKALSAGVAGWRDDDLAFVADWGFSLDRLTVPVAIWQGAQDRMVPSAHGRWLGAHVAGVQAHLEPGEGHLSLIANFDAIVTDLLRAAGIRE
jgi:pimeloyl-ACP methyl ester carboxylesterase